jgi:hypothetical protein
MGVAKRIKDYQRNSYGLIYLNQLPYDSDRSLVGLSEYLQSLYL